MTSEDHFAGETAVRYDAAVGDMAEADQVGAAVRCLAELSGRRPALEFAIGTGRIGLPLAAAGVDVSGIELSPDMVAQLRAKPGGDALAVTMGDMASVRVDGEFGLVYLVFNTIGNLVTQDAQVACFRNAAAHLIPGGVFVIELLVPQLQRLAPGDRFQVFDHSPEHVGIDEIDPLTQRLDSHHWTPQQGWSAIPFRYAWPAELDLMARLAGMTLRDRWADWDGAPFTAASPSHVSVWQRPAA